MSKPGNLKSVTLCLIAYCYKMENLADLKKNLLYSLGQAIHWQVISLCINSPLIEQMLNCITLSCSRLRN